MSPIEKKEKKRKRKEKKEKRGRKKKKKEANVDPFPPFPWQPLSQYVHRLPHLEDKEAWQNLDKEAIFAPLLTPEQFVAKVAIPALCQRCYYANRERGDTGNSNKMLHSKYCPLNSKNDGSLPPLEMDQKSIALRCRACTQNKDPNCKQTTTTHEYGCIGFTTKRRISKVTPDHYMAKGGVCFGCIDALERVFIPDAGWRNWEEQYHHPLCAHYTGTGREAPENAPKLKRKEEVLSWEDRIAMFVKGRLMDAVLEEQEV